MNVPVNPQNSALLTDLYQLTMLQAYIERGMEETAVFEFFVRKLPPTRGFLIAAGLEQVLEYVENVRFTPSDLEWLAGRGGFSKSFITYLERFRFTGDVHAMPEGTVFFPDEPILRITAPLPQAQLVETRVMNLVHFQTLIASKAARSVLAAPGKTLIDFGLRRAHGAEAGLLAARASYLAGFAGTATVLAGSLFGIPVYGTMAHSFVQAHENETEAFEHFASAHPNNVVLLIDTYDTEAAVEKVIALAQTLKKRGITIKGVRLDSGDLADHARKVRSILDRGGLSEVQIVASGGLDEYALRRLCDEHAPIDTFAIGTAMTTSADVPYLDCAYKLQEYAGRRSPQTFGGKGDMAWAEAGVSSLRRAGLHRSDVLTLADDPQEGTPLIQPFVAAGKTAGASHPVAGCSRKGRRRTDTPA